MTGKEQTEQKLLNAAMEVFSRKGYTSSSVSDIIKEAGVARGTFYLYFESKKNAFEQVLALVLESIEILTPPEHENTFRTPQELYKRIYGSYIGFLTLFKKNSAFARIVFTEALGLDKGFDKQLSEHYNAHRRNVKRFLKGVSKTGFSRSFNPDIMCEAIIGWSERCARVFASDDHGMSLEELALELADFEFSSLCTASIEEARKGLS